MADWPPLKGASFLAVFPLYDNTGCPLFGAAGLAASWSKDGAAFAAASNTPAEINASAGVYSLACASTEMNADVVAFKVISTTACSRSAIGVMYTVTRQIKDVAYTGQALAELAQAKPAATPTLEQALMLPYMALRNSASTTTSVYKITNDAGTVIAKAAIAESASVFSRDEMESGP